VDTVSADWSLIRDEYLSSDMSYRDLCNKHGVKYGCLSKIASKEGWHSARKEKNSVSLSREERILSISDSLLDKIEKSISELDRCVVKCKERTKTLEYDYDTKKPINEVVEEKEDIQIIEGMIDKMGLKQLVSTLKDIKDIHRSIEGGEESAQEESGVIVLSEVCEDTDGESDDEE